jgi:hypothetical protein
MTLPLHFLRRMSAPGGNRLPKQLLLQETAGKCPACNKPVYKTRLLGAYQVDGTFTRGDYYHKECAPVITYPVEWRRSSILESPKGNLGPEEYRFWIGSLMPASALAMCRCCRTSVYGARDRAQHFRDEKFRVGGDQCTVRLIKAYARMLHSPSCLVCKKQRFNHQQWGIPICEQTRCLTEWKFGQDRWIALEAELELQRAKAEWYKQHPGQAPPEPIHSELAFITNSEKLTVRQWCPSCKMFEDSANHALFHANHLVGGVDTDEDNRPVFD